MIKLPQGVTSDILKARIHNNKEGAFNFQERRHNQWDENYHLYRDTVFIDRIKQRQSINAPFTKEAMKTLLPQMDDTPDILFENQGNDDFKTKLFNEYFKYCTRKCNLELKDIVSKKQVLLYGRTHMLINIENGRLVFKNADVYDIIVDRNVDPTDIETARYIGWLHIYMPFSKVAKNPLYDADAVSRLYTDISSVGGIKKNSENMESLQAKNERMEQMGDWEVNTPTLGEFYLELNHHFIKIAEERDGEQYDCVYIVTTCDEEILQCRPLEDVLNVNFFPIETWGEEVESDYWMDGAIDAIRPLNKVANVWLSQYTENRTIRNFGMYTYNGNNPNFVPQTIEPGAWKWIATPGNPNETIRPLEIPEISSAMNDIGFLKGMGERVTAATPVMQGAVNSTRVTLGEVELAQKSASDRATSIKKYYKNFYMRLGDKAKEIILNNTDALHLVDLIKKSPRGKYQKYELDPAELIDETGYNVVVTSSSDKNKEDMETIQAMSGVLQVMQGNPVLSKIFKKKTLGLLNLTPDEESAILDYEEQKAKEPTSQPGTQQPGMIPDLTQMQNNPMNYAAQVAQ